MICPKPQDGADRPFQEQRQGGPNPPTTVFPSIPTRSPPPNSLPGSPTGWLPVSLGQCPDPCPWGQR